MPRPIDTIVPDREQNEIGKSPSREQVFDLSGKIVSAEDSPKKTLTLAFVIDQRPDPGILDGNERHELFQLLRDALNAAGWIDIQEPVFTTASARAPQCPRRAGNVEIHANAV